MPRVRYNSSCVWRQYDDYNNIWEITGDGSGNWVLTCYNNYGTILWRGTKSGSLGTSEGDTPEGSFTRVWGCDTTATRSVSPNCLHCPTTVSSCNEQYDAVIDNTNTGLDGTWRVVRYDDQPFWSSSNGGTKPESADANAELDVSCEGDVWVTQINNSTICQIRWIVPLEGTACPPSSGWEVDMSLSSESSGSFLATSFSSQSSLSSQSYPYSCGFTWNTGGYVEPADTLWVPPFPAVLTGVARQVDSPEGSIQTHGISHLIFSGTSDDVVILIHADTSVVTTVTPPGGPSDSSTITLPSKYYLYRDTEGWITSTQKTYTDGINTHVKPDDELEHHVIDMEASGFSTIPWGTLIPVSDLEAKGWIDPDGMFRFKFVLCVSGWGRASVNATCTEEMSSSSEIKALETSSSSSEQSLLLAHYKFDEGVAPSQFLDYSVFHNILTPVDPDSGMSMVSGVFTGAVEFSNLSPVSEGTNVCYASAVVPISSALSQNAYHRGTFSGWYNVAAAIGGEFTLFNILMTDGSGSSLTGKELLVRIVGIYIEVSKCDSQEIQFFSLPVDIRDDSWHYYAVVWDDTSISVYFDGELLTIFSDTLAVSSSPPPQSFVRIGLLSEGDSLYRDYIGGVSVGDNGKIRADQVKLFSRAYSSVEIAALYSENPETLSSSSSSSTSLSSSSSPSSLSSQSPSSLSSNSSSSSSSSSSPSSSNSSISSKSSESVGNVSSSSSSGSSSSSSQSSGSSKSSESVGNVSSSSSSSNSSSSSSSSSSSNSSSSPSSNSSSSPSSHSSSSQSSSSSSPSSGSSSSSSSISSKSSLSSRSSQSESSRSSSSSPSSSSGLPVCGTGSTLTLTPVTLHPDAVVFEIFVNHYSETETISWHVNAQLTEVDDTSFVSPIMSISSLDDQSGWAYRIDEIGVSGAMEPLGVGGITTHRSLSRNMDGSTLHNSIRFGHTERWTATAYYTLDAGEISLLIKDKQYLLRTRQYDGSDWGEWLSVTVRV